MSSKSCLGGALLSFEYQTAVVDEKNRKLCLENGTKTDDVLNMLVNEAYAAACGPSSSAPLQGKWVQYGLQIEILIRNLTALSAQAATADPQSTSQANSNTQASVKAVGMQCFEQLCQNLSGPLLLFPISKKILAKCIQQLADEFLTSLSAAYERVLDLMVALPHLSGVLIDIRSWCTNQPDIECPLPVGSPARYKALLFALYGCLKQTTQSSADRTPQDEKLYERYFEFLKSVLRTRLTASITPVIEILMDEICNPRSEPLWVVLHQILLDEKQDYGKCTISVEKLLVVLNIASVRLSKSSPKSEGLQETILDEFLLLPFKYVQIVLSVFQTLLCELATKLGCCVREKHTTTVCGEFVSMKHFSTS
ncbi:unnamed protein product [Echinostoma caproni]|uniref:Fanconi anemia group I protein n=1 Tax=Echinostoma caproni TaxID=27848 RepID=A0A183AX86_9TREM|nr:unnamed protein product [Echinostoma caproni]